MQINYVVQSEFFIGPHHGMVEQKVFQAEDRVLMVVMVLDF